MSYSDPSTNNRPTRGDLPVEIADKVAELERLRRKMESESDSLKQLFRDAAEADAEYELAKNKELIAMFKEEARSDYAGGKRTETIRAAIYREKLHELRERRTFTKYECDALREYLKVLAAMQLNLQSQLSLEKEMMRF